MVTQNLLVLAFLGLLVGCATNLPTTRYEVGRLGYFEYREPEPGMKGMVVGAPHGGSAPATVALARQISERMGVGFVAAYGFKSRQISVERPLIRSHPYLPVFSDLAQPRSVFAEFKEILRRITPDIDFYVGIRQRPAGMSEDLQVVTSGFSIEEVELIKQSYLDIRDRVIDSQVIGKMSISLDPLATMSWPASGLKHHGVLLVAEKGLSLSVPEKLLSGANLDVYGEILTAWVEAVERITRDSSQQRPQIEVRVMDFGRLDLIPSRKGITGVVIGAPHGTYDEYTAEIVEQLGYRTGLATVIARGFSPTEAGGWRINVNRPTERSYLTPDFEVSSSRSREIFTAFKQAAIDAAGGNLRIHFDVHQYGYDTTIQVATVGVDARQALRIKEAYQRIRDRQLIDTTGIDRVDLLIEPSDQIEIGAWPAKYRGILGVARQSLHFELPLHSALRSRESRELYIRVIAELVVYVQKELAK